MGIIKFISLIFLTTLTSLNSWNSWNACAAESSTENRNDNDVFHILDQKVFPLKGRNVLRLKDLRVELISENGIQKGFQIKTENQILHEVMIPADQVVVYENYIVIKPVVNSVVGSKFPIQQLMFIDLGFYRPLLGQSELPIYHLPLQTEIPASELNPIHIEKNRLSGKLNMKVGDVEFDGRIIEFYSKIQQTIWNTLVTLLDPKHWNASAAILDDLGQFFEQAVDLAGYDLKAQVESITAGKTGLQLLRDKTMASLSGIKNTQQATELVASLPDQAMTALSGNALQKTLNSISGAYQNQKKLLNRITLLWSRFNLPKPSSVFTVKKSLLYVAGLTALGAAHPEPVAEFMQNSFEMVRTAGEYVWGLSKISGHGTQDTLAGYNPFVFAKTYLTSENLPKVLEGSFHIFQTGFMVMSSVHILTNLGHMIQDFKKNPDLFALLKKGQWKKAFVQRQAAVQAHYLDDLAQAELREQHAETPVFTAEEEQEIQTLITPKKKFRFFEKHFSGLKEKMSIPPVVKALSHFLFSLSSVTNTCTTTAKVWHAWFKVRTFVWYPSAWVVTALYPSYFNTALSAESGLHLPTKWNGGSLTVLDRVQRWFISGQDRKTVEEFEKRILPYEEKIHEAVMKASLKATLDASTDLNAAHMVVKNLGDHSRKAWLIEGMAAEQKVYFNAYFTTLFDTSMEKLVQAIQATDAEVSPEDSNNQIERWVKQAEESDRFTTQFTSRRGTLRGFLQEKLETMKFSLMKKMDPSTNSHTNAVQTVQNQMKKPKAMARAVRSAVAAALVDKPIEFAVLLATLAGVSEGLNVPLGDQFSATHWHYLSTNAFVGGYLFNLVQSMLSDVWSKLRQDVGHESGFGEVPTSEEAKKGIFHWFIKKGLFHEKNTVWNNYKNLASVYWSSLPAWSIQAALLYWLSLGRFDLDQFLIGYFFTFLTPLEAMLQKIEYTYEYAASFSAHLYTPKQRLHPLVQEELGQKQTKQRLVFNVFYQFIANFYYDWKGVMETMGTPDTNRIFTRFMFNGARPTELIVNGLLKVGQATGLQKLAIGCALLLTKGDQELKGVPNQ